MIRWIETYATQRMFMHMNGGAGFLAIMLGWSMELFLLICCGVINLVCAWIASENSKFYKVRERNERERTRGLDE